jgi:uncharacterized ubiquitin-like protein YukD
MHKKELDMFDRAIKALQKAEGYFLKEDYLESYQVTNGARKQICQLSDKIETSICRQHIQNCSKKDQMTEDEKKKFMMVNDALTNLEKKIKQETGVIIEECKKRVMFSTEDFLIDYEIEIEVVFILSDTDPRYSNDRDNIMAKYVFCGKDNQFIGTGENWNIWDIDKEPEDRPYHCYLFHCIYDHTNPPLSWKDVLSIGDIWTDIIVRYQNHIQIPIEL